MILISFLLVIFLFFVFVMVTVKRSENEKLKNYTSTVLIVLCTLITILSLFLFLKELLSGDYKYYAHPAYALISLLFPIAISVTLFFARNYILGKLNKWYVPFLLGLGTYFLMVIPANTINIPPSINAEQEWAMKWNDIGKVKSNLNGTIWTYTSSIGEDDMFNMWCKLEFKNDKLYYYEVSPSEGEWGEPQVCDYSIEERRYSNTGNKYIGIFWESLLMKYLFVPSEKSISYQGRNGYVFGAYLTMEDVNPWY